MSTNQVEQGKDKPIDKIQKIDFKMISFSLAGKDYGIDILKVKEIRKAGNFTKVPNTPIYVKGVDNLRGDIIPIIDLRVMFNLPAESKEPNSLENIIILRLEELVLGVVVDSIEKVIGFSKETIQPPHPIFGDINIQYIAGVVQSEGRLYIILDVDRIFGETDAEEAAPEVESIQAELSAPPPLSQDPAARTQEALDLQFIGENLANFGNFHLTSVNQDWVVAKMEKWKVQRASKGLDFQFNHKDDVDEFLSDFYSTNTARIWPKEAVDQLAEKLSFQAAQTMIWNPGCGKGYESYSLALLMETRFPKKGYKIWANDSDLLNISTAPSLVLDDEEISPKYKSFTVQAKSGLQFNSELKSHILFEFHDINNMNPLNEVHLVVVRDLLSFLKPVEQAKILSELAEKVRPGGLLIVGQNERIPQQSEWKFLGFEEWSLYQRT